MALSSQRATVRTVPGVAGLNAASARGMLLTPQSSGNFGATAANTDAVAGAVVTPALENAAGEGVEICVQGFCQVQADGTGTAIAVGDPLEAAASGKAVRQATESGASRMYAMEATTADTLIRAYFV